MKVRATGPGHYVIMRDAGDIFEIPDELFSPVWMDKIEETQKEKEVREWLENEKKASDEAKGE